MITIPYGMTVFRERGYLLRVKCNLNAFGLDGTNHNHELLIVDPRNYNDLEFLPDEQLVSYDHGTVYEVISYTDLLFGINMTDYQHIVAYPEHAIDGISKELIQFWNAKGASLIDHDPIGIYDSTTIIINQSRLSHDYRKVIIMLGLTYNRIGVSSFQDIIPFPKEWINLYNRTKNRELTDEAFEELVLLTHDISVKEELSHIMIPPPPVDELREILLGIRTIDPLNGKDNSYYTA